MKRKAFSILLCAFLMIGTDLYAQIIVRGTVSDSVQVTIPYVQVILYDSTNTKIIDFTQCDSLGTYQILVEEPGIYNLAFSILSHKPVNVPVKVRSFENDSLVVINVTLTPRSLELEEIVVQSQRSIRVRGDTIAMKVGDFLRGDEEVVEDALKVLPGFDVDEDGTIRFAGKQITKVMVEGSDLFGKGYSMLTKNLDVNVLEDVEVLQNFSELSELRGLRKSDDVAINLSLKEEVKFEFFGNTSLGINTLEKHEAKLVLTSLNKKIKQYILVNSASLGNDPFGDLDQFAGAESSDFPMGSLLNLNNSYRNYSGRSLLPLSSRRMRFNNSKLGSYNAIFKPNSNFELKIISAGTFEKDQLNRQIESKYLSDDVILRDLETFNLNDKINSGLLKIETNLKPNETSRLEYKGFIKTDESSANSLVRIREENLIEDFGIGTWETSHSLNFIKRINKDRALVLLVNYDREHFDDFYGTNPLFAGELFGLSSGEISGHQKSIFDINSAYSRAVWMARIGNKSILEIDAKTLYAAVDNTLDFFPENVILNTSGNTPTFPLRNDLAVFKSSLGMLGRYSIGIFNLFSGVELAYLDPKYHVNSKQKSTPDYLLIKPKTGVDWKLGLNKFQLSYLYDATISDIQEMLDGFTIADRRTVKKGLGDFHMYRGHNAIINYTYGGWLRRNMVNTTLLYNKNNRVISNEAIVNSNFSLLQNTLSTDREVFLANTSADILLPRFKNNLKLSSSFSSTNIGSLFNEEVYYIRTSIRTHGLNFRSVFDGKFNYTIGASWLHQTLNTGSNKVKTKQFQYTDLYFDLNKVLKFQFVVEREFALQQNIESTTYLMDAYMHLQIKPNKLKLTVEARNLLNNEYFVSNNLTGLQLTSTRYELIPRHVLVSINYRL